MERPPGLEGAAEHNDSCGRHMVTRAWDKPPAAYRRVLVVRLTTQADFRKVQELPFCYICGQEFGPKDEKTRDHIPPKSIFKGADRLDPLCLPTHATCNNSYATDDEKIGQLVGVLHGRYPKPQNVRIDVRPFKPSGANVPVGVLRGMNLPPLIGRWVRAFHAALYYEPLPSATDNFIHPPFPSGHMKDGRPVWDKILMQHPVFVATIKKNQLAGRTDRLSCYNNKCVYECVWEEINGVWACIFALNVYDWSKLGDQTGAPKRGCVGFYQPLKGKPLNGTSGVSQVLELPEPRGNPLDAFDRFDS
jgi:hypothetical protein